VTKLAFAALALALAAVSADARGPTDRAPVQLSEMRVIDGDTLIAKGVRHRLFGIDAPEHDQNCPDGWPAGQHATAFLVELTRRAPVECDDFGYDRYGRTLSVCRANGRDLNAALVQAGLAWAYVRYSSLYAGLEAEAKAAGRGVHGHRCAPAWEFRHRGRPGVS
jgi:endonuclease YncB( thermonuclease family)